MTARTPSRRRLLQALGAGLAGSLAGCQTGGTDSTTTSPSATTAQSDRTSTPGGTTPPGETRTVDSPGTTTPSGTTPPGGGELSPGTVAAGDRFGHAVAVEGRTAVVGAPKVAVDGAPVGGGSDGVDGAGSAVVFEWTDGEWSQRTRLAAGDDGDAFGWSVALDGDRLLVGAYGDEEPAGEKSGSAYLFERTDEDWQRVAQLVAGDGDSYDRFGWSVALDNGRALIGAFNNEGGSNGDSTGAAYVFTESGGDWNRTAKLASPELAPEAYFGRSVALAGETALVGARRDSTVFGGERAGAAYVFERDADGWHQQDKLFAEDGDTWDLFGESVALDGDRALIGAYNDEDPVGADRFSGAGTAYVFERGEENWRQQAKLTAEEGASDDTFGQSVALAGGTALVGARNATVDGVEQAGAAYRFEQADGEWIQRRRQVAEDANEEAHFGDAVALSEAVALVGGPGIDGDDADAIGRAVAFSLS